MHTYIHTYIYIYKYIDLTYLFVYNNLMCVHVYVYIYIYIYVCCKFALQENTDKSAPPLQPPVIAYCPLI